MKILTEKLLDQTGALQSGGVIAFAGFAVVIADFFWAPRFWSQDHTEAVFFVIISLGALVAAGIMLANHEADKPVSMISGLIASALGFAGILFRTVQLKQGKLPEDFGVISAILYMHVPLYIGGLINLISGHAESGNSEGKDKYKI